MGGAQAWRGIQDRLPGRAYSSQSGMRLRAYSTPALAIIGYLQEAEARGAPDLVLFRWYEARHHEIYRVLELEPVDDELAVEVDVSVAVLALVVLDVVGVVAVLAVVRDDNDDVEAVPVVVRVDADELLDIEVVVAVLADDVVVVLVAVLAVVRDDAVVCVLAVVVVGVELLVSVEVLVGVNVVVAVVVVDGLVEFQCVAPGTGGSDSHSCARQTVRAV